MDSILLVTSAAPDRTLLTIEELRSAADVEDKSLDAELKQLGAAVANRIAYACRIRRGGALPATLREETLLETFRHARYGFGATGGGVHHYGHRGPRRLRLSRRPIVELKSITFDGTSGDVSQYVLDPTAGFVEQGPSCSGFYGNSVAISYRAGFATVPDDLKAAAISLVQQYLGNASQEPGLRGITIPDVIQRTYQAGQATDADLPQAIVDMLATYRNED